MKLALTSLALAGLMFAELQLPTGPIRPTVLTNSVQPHQGPISGGTVATITGSGLASATVTIDGQPVTPTAQTDSSIALTMPPHDNGYVVIAVRGGDGTTAYHRFLYVPPRLDEIPAGAITTVAGVGTFKGDFGPALEANLDPNNLVIDRQGNIYLAEANFAQVSRIRTDGVIERVAGNGVTPRPDRPCCGDGGPATQALVGFPRGVALDADGNLLIGEDDNRIRRVDARTGVITTVAGTGRPGFSGDGGPATSAQITQVPRVVVFGTAIFFLDFGNARIRRIGPDGRISTVAGNGVRGFAGDGGPAVSASLDLTFNGDATALAVDGVGNLFLVEGTPGRIRRVDAQTGIISTFFSWIPAGGSQGIAVDRDGNVYLPANRSILKISPSGSVVKSWGIEPADFSPDGTLLEQLHFGIITGMTFDTVGNLVISDQPAGRVRRLNFSTNRIETIAGTAPGTIGDEGPAVGAALQLLNGDIALTRSGDLLIADMRVRRVNPEGIIRTIAGNAFGMGAYTNKTNVPALNYWNGAIALFVGPTDEIDTASFAAAPYHIDNRGMAQMITSGARCGSLNDGGPATAASLCQSWDITRDRDGHIFIADTNNNRIRRIDARSGTISTVAGTGPSNGFENYYPGRGEFCGDGGPAVNACLATPASVAFDPDGNLFISDTMNRRIRRVDRLSGVITTFVQLPKAVMTIRFDRLGNLYANLADRLVRFDRNGGMTTVAGTAGALGFSGDGGPALQARIDMGYAQSSGIAINDAGDVFFVDAGNRRVRAVKSGALLGAPVQGAARR